MGNKSTFITLYLVYAAAMFIWSVVALANVYSHFWMLNGLLHLIPMLLILRFYAFPIARTAGKLPLLTALNCLIILAIITGVFTNSIQHHELLVLPVIGFCGWLLYVYWYSQLPMHNHNEIAVGSTLPEVKLKNLSGQKIGNDYFDGEFNVLLFYRGNWCPLCMAQINELASAYSELDRLGAKVFLISPQPPYKSQKLARKHKVNFNFLIDHNAATARKFRIYHRNGTPLGMEVFGYEPHTVLPTVIIINKENEIIFIAQTDNYRVRPVPSTYIEAIQSAL